jgi:glycosyltransferase involved in cell wall biosynthesis
MNKSILFLVNVDWFFVSHRLPIAIAAMETGYKVHLACTYTDKADYLASLGITLHPLPLSRSGIGIGPELKSFLAVYKLIRRLNPDIVHFITIKPVLYGGIASRLAGIKYRAASISGLGYVFVANGLRAKVFRFFISIGYRMALKDKRIRVIFQNPEDKTLLIKSGAIFEQQAIILKGSGVSLNSYPYAPEPEDIPVVTFASRLLKDKGVEEFVQAAELLKTRGVPARFWLVGDADPGNPATVSQQKINAWHEADIVEILGYRSDIPRLFSQSNIIALPSYYGEGLPKVLVEAAACGRAVVTTDHPGCRDAIKPDKTGLLVPVRDAVALADAIQRLIENPDLRKSMGQAGRELAEREYAIENIVNAHLDIYENLVDMI